MRRRKKKYKPPAVPAREPHDPWADPSFKTFRIALAHGISRKKFDAIVARIGEYVVKGALRPYADGTCRGLVVAIDARAKDMETADWFAFSRLWEYGIKNTQRVRAAGVQEVHCEHAQVG